MAYVVAPGGIFLPDSPLTEPAVITVGPIDATGEKLAIIGRVRWANNAATKNIRRVQFAFGAITKSGGSGLTVSLQDVSLTAGPTFQPDGTPDQTVAIANGDASFASNTWYRTGTLSADRTAARGDLLAVVIEYDGSGRLGSDIVRLLGDGTSGLSRIHNSGWALFTASWPSTSVTGAGANIILEADDGTLGTFDYCRPLLNSATESTYNTASTPDETGNAFTLPFDCYVDGIWAQVRTPVVANFDLVLYKGTTALQTVSVDANTLATTAASAFFAPIAETQIERNVEHYVIVKPTSGTSVGLQGITVNDAAHWDFWPGGQAMCYASRVDAGSFSKTTTKRLPVGVRISQLDDGTGAGSTTVVAGVIGS